MAARGRRVPGNPLASKLRDMELRTRARRNGPAGTAGPPGPTGPAGTGEPGPAGPAGTGMKGRNSVTTGQDGTATWAFPWQPDGLPTVAAVARSETPVVVTVAALSQTSVTVAAWTLQGVAASGVNVHITTFV